VASRPDAIPTTSGGSRLVRGLFGSGYELFVARRYLWSRPLKSFISLISIFAVCGVIVGVLALTITLSAMNGFEDEVRAKIVGSNAHIVVLTRRAGGMEDYESVASRVEQMHGVVGTAPMLYSKAMLSLGRRADGAVIKGIDIERERGVSDVPDLIVPPIAAIDGASSSELPGIVLGFDIALNLSAGIGDTVHMSSAMRTVRTPMGVVPLVKKFEVVGLYRSGMYEYDSSFCFISIPAAQQFMEMEERITGIEVKITDMYQAIEMGDEIERLLGPPYFANNWIRVNQNLFAWMKLEKVLMFMILLLIVLVAAFNIASMLIMVVMDKKRDIGVLRSMGASSTSIMRIFILQGLQVALVGVAIGSLLGFVSSWVIDRYEIVELPSDIYFIDTLPIRVDPLDFLLVAAATVLICLLGAVYPAWRAARLVPVEAIRYE
jgi:lipoprotein-releasing system permease protein